MATCVFRIDKFIMGNDDKYLSCYIDFIEKKLMNYPSEEFAKERGVTFKAEVLEAKPFLTVYYLIYKKEGSEVNLEELLFFLKKHGYEDKAIYNKISKLNGSLSTFISTTCNCPSDELDLLHYTDNIYSFETKNGYYVDERGEEIKKPIIEEPQVFNRKVSKKEISPEDEEFVKKLDNYDDEKIIEKIADISTSKNSVIKSICFEAIKRTRSSGLIRELIGLMDNNDEKYKLCDMLAENGYIDTCYFQWVVDSIDNSLYLYRTIRLLIFYNKLTLIERIFSHLRNNNYIAYSLEAIYEADKDLCRKLYKEGKCFRPSPKERIAHLLEE